ncbi:MAG: neutral/alkaline non-lysosomal ceramidase N-terminal domain-containing protein [Candidatus Brocadiia bacterium]
MPRLRAGIARANLTPYVGAFLAGFASRDRPSEGIHDELFARALVLEAGQRTVALVTCDLVGLGTDSVGRIREHVEEATAIAPDAVMVACTHTHSGPTTGILRHPGFDPHLLAVTERKIAGAVAEAHRSMAEAALGWGTGQVPIGVNRRERGDDGAMRLGRNDAGPVDHELGVLRVDGAEGRPMALVAVYACHPVVLGGGNYLVSADFPGQLAALVERVHPGALCGFLNGACGNINPPRVGGSFEDARRLGMRLGAEALAAAERVECRPEVVLEARQAVADAPLDDLPPAGEARDLVEARTKELDQQLARGELSRELADADPALGYARDVVTEYGNPRRPSSRPLELHALRLGEGLVVGMPGETFVELGAAIQAASPLPHTFVVGYANGTVGYIPTDAAFQEGGYEVERAHQFYRGIYRFAPGTEAAVVEAGTALAAEAAQA